MILSKTFIVVILLLYCSYQNQYKIEFNIKNNTEFIINDLNVYSQKFKKLKPKKSTGYRKICFDELTHNSIISLTVKEKRYMIYTTRPIKGKSTLSIDSLDVKRRIIYYRIFSK